ncbi:MAG: bacterioferritin [Myxococcota bacterium]
MGKADQEIIALLNDVLTAELTAINQYFMHSELCQHWGYSRLHAEARKQSIGEMKHAESLIKRILYLNGMPNLQRLGSIKIGETVAEQFKVDLALEGEAITRLNQGIEATRAKGDNGTRILLEEILRSEEEHYDWLDTQIGLMKQLGEQAYLAEQM